MIPYNRFSNTPGAPITAPLPKTIESDAPGGVGQIDPVIGGLALLAGAVFVGVLIGRSKRR